MRRRNLAVLAALLSAVLLLLPGLPVRAGAAENLGSMDRVVSREGFANCWKLFDGDQHEAIPITAGSRITLRDPEGFGSAYLIFDEVPGAYTISAGGESRVAGEKGFLHEFVDLEALFGAAPGRVEIAFPEGDVRLNELYLFPPGETPEFVQKWKEAPEGKVDLMLFSTHGDDEQLFFAGLLPEYAGQRGYEVAVAYLTDHRNFGTLRCHEMLDGLWSVGVRNYPILGPFPDQYSRSKTRAYDLMRGAGFGEEELTGFVVEQLRRFRPQAAVGHDPEGEYGHGQHMLYSELLRWGVEAAGDPERFPESGERYGVWETPKTYLHLWPEGEVMLDYDHPLECFGGMTAFEVSQKRGFPCHKSQKWGFSWYIDTVERAADIPKYSPCRFGLYRSTVGKDTGKGDLFEHLVSYGDREVLGGLLREEGTAMVRLRRDAEEEIRLRQRQRDTERAAGLHRQEARAAEREARLRRWVLAGVSAGITGAVVVVWWRKNKYRKF